jgi:predicted Zn-dependent protease
MNRALCAALVLWIGGCTTTMTGRKQLTLVSEGRMNALGASAFASIKRKQKLSRDPAVNEYAQCVASAILEVVPPSSGPKDGNWEVRVFEDSTPNAFALPGGKIGIHTGMLEVASTPGRLAAVIGHEVAHVLLRHGNERMSQALIAQGVAAASSVAVGVRAPRYQELVALGLGIGAQFGVLLPFSRKHESEADYIGQLFMARAGFYPAEAVVLWQAMARHDGDAPPQWQSTHPSDRSRVARLEATLPAAMRAFEKARAAGKDPWCAPPGQSMDHIEGIWRINQQ